jgi:flagellar biosynthesis/type III secretory pathway protein FliH
MQRLKLPDGSYVNPGEVERLGVKKHFFGKNYCVQIHLDNGRAVDICTDLPELKAQEARHQYEQQLETLAADISAYKEGRAAGLSRGKKIGYANGHKDGYDEGFVAGVREAHDQASQAGVDAVLCELRCRLNGLYDEMRYHEHLVEPRRQSLISMIELLESIVAMFVPQQQASTNPDGC